MRRLNAYAEQEGDSVGALEREHFNGEVRFVNASYTPNAVPVAGGGKCFFSKVRRFVSGVVNGGCASSESRAAECAACDISFSNCSDCNL